VVHLVYYGGMQGTVAMPDIYSWTATEISFSFPLLDQELVMVGE
jgi:hypothetical protein